jgi:hypothetical protein
MSEERIGEEPAEDELDLDEPEGDEIEEGEPEPDEGGEPEPESEPGAEPQPVAKPGRAQERISTLTRRARELEEQNRLLTQRLLLGGQPAAPAAPDPTRQAEADRLELERISMLPPAEMLAAIQRKVSSEYDQKLQMTQLRVGEAMDQQAFRLLQRDEPAARRLAPKVEEALAEARRAGMNPSREQVFNMLFGQEMREKSRRAAETQRRRGERQIQAQRTQPGVGRSTVPASRRPTGDSEEEIEARIGDLTI